MTRASDHAALTSAVLHLGVGGSDTIRTHERRPAEDRPAFTRFTARLSATKSLGLLDLVTRVDLREAMRNKKGKLKISDRNIGALLPIRPGETQIANLAGDPIQIEVRIERD